jgi:hypothetical protein
LVWIVLESPFIAAFWLAGENEVASGDLFNAQ